MSARPSTVLVIGATGSIGLDGARDTPNMPLDREPERVREDLRALTGRS
jgi:hypothetical protein